jgi:hypothetical protein
LLSLWEAILVFILVQEAILLFIPSGGILVIVLVQEVILVVIPMGGQISYFIIEGLLSLVREPICIGWLLS